jgi:hypothetical protein
MADGEIGAVFEGLATDAGEAGENIAESIAEVSEKAADIEAANLDSVEAADRKAAQALDAAGRGDASGSVGPVGDPLETGIPHGFPGPAEYDTFVNTLNRGLADAGYADTEAAFQGSSVTGFSYSEGLPFRPDSDYDIAVGGQRLFDRARAIGIPLRSRGTRTAPLSPREVRELGLEDMHAHLERLAGRDVHFMIFQSIDRAMARGPSVPAIPHGGGAS